MNLYAYCLSNLVTPDALADITGIQGKSARLIRYGSIQAVVSDFEGERADVTKENALAHDRVIRQVLAARTPLPFRFGMIAGINQLEAYIAAHRAGLLSQLARVRDSVEMSVKIIWDADSIRRAASERAEGMNITQKLNARGPGADFLRAKQHELIADQTLKQQAEQLAGWLGERLGGSVRETVARMLPSEAMALAVSHLVERARLKQYRERLSQAKIARSDLRFLTSGEWPPYSFCDLDS